MGLGIDGDDGFDCDGGLGIEGGELEDGSAVGGIGGAVRLFEEQACNSRTTMPTEVIRFMAFI